MRWVASVLILVGVMLAAMTAWYLTSHQPARPTEQLTGTSNEDNSSLAAQGAGEDAAAEQDPIRIDDEALMRLEAELSKAEPVHDKSDEERLAEAWEWVRANRPADRPYNELEAKMLALLEVIVEGEKRDALWMMNSSLIEFEMVRALDANRDGIVTDDEVARFREENISMLSALDHPYIKAKLDTDGDGELSSEEMAKLEGLASMQGAFAGVLERAQIERWDTDLDGVLTDAELEAGKSAMLSQVKFFPDGHVELVDDPSEILPEEQEQAKAELAEKFGENVLEVLESQKEMLATQALVQDLAEAMRVENMDQNQMREELMKSVPKAPSQMDFDADGDGVITDTENQAFAEALQEYQKRMQEWSAQQTTLALRMEFEHATSEHDANGDGRMSEDEWDTRLHDLLTARGRRLFLRSYDIDRSGRVDPDELNRFLDWHKNKSLRADANFDGQVDIRDLEKMLANYRDQ